MPRATKKAKTDAGAAGELAAPSSGAGGASVHHHKHEQVHDGLRSKDYIHHLRGHEGLSEAKHGHVATSEAGESSEEASASRLKAVRSRGKAKAPARRGKGMGKGSAAAEGKEEDVQLEANAADTEKQGEEGELPKAGSKRKSRATAAVIPGQTKLPVGSTSRAGPAGQPVREPDVPFTALAATGHALPESEELTGATGVGQGSQGPPIGGASSSGISAIGAGAVQGTVKRVLYIQRPGPDASVDTLSQYRPLLAANFSVPEQQITFFSLPMKKGLGGMGDERRDLPLDTQLQELTKEFIARVTEKSGMTKDWVLWFDRGGQELGITPASLIPMPTFSGPFVGQGQSQALGLGLSGSALQHLLPPSSTTQGVTASQSMGANAPGADIAEDEEISASPSEEDLGNMAEDVDA